MLMFFGYIDEHDDDNVDDAGDDVSNGSNDFYVPARSKCNKILYVFYAFLRAI